MRTAPNSFQKRIGRVKHLVEIVVCKVILYSLYPFWLLVEWHWHRELRSRPNMPQIS